MANQFALHCPESREASLAITKLEEAIMWANAAIARRPESEDASDAALVAERADEPRKSLADVERRLGETASESLDSGL